MPEHQKNALYYGDNLPVLREHFPDSSVDLIYLDPPFNSRQDYNILIAGSRSALAHLRSIANHSHPSPEAADPPIPARIPRSAAPNTRASNSSRSRACWKAPSASNARSTSGDVTFKPAPKHRRPTVQNLTLDLT